MNDDQILTRAETLARRAASAGVHEDQLALALSHLKRHQDVAATLRLLAELLRSPFSRRNNRTLNQFRAMEENVRSALQGVASWQDAAGIIGWARRLLKFYQPEGNRSHVPNRGWR